MELGPGNAAAPRIHRGRLFRKYLLLILTLVSGAGAALTSMIYDVTPVPRQVEAPAARKVTQEPRDIAANLIDSYQALWTQPFDPSAAPKSLDEVDPKLLETYAKLGIPLKEQEILAGVRKQGEKSALDEDSGSENGSGRVAIDFGVYGVPETYVVTADGRIAYRHVGPLSEEAIREKILPLLQPAAGKARG